MMETIVDALEQRAGQDADRRAYRFFVTGEPDSPQTTRTWRQVWSFGTAVAARLIDEGLVGQRALLLLDDGIHFIDAFFGCLLAGVVAVPVTPPDPRRLDRTLPRLRGIARDCEATVIVSTSAIAAMAGALRDQAPDLHAMRWIVVDEISGDDGRHWRRPAGLDRSTLAVLQYTSGSTGAPAGVRVSHHNLVTYCDVARELYRVERDTRVFTWLPLFHDMGLMGGIVVPTRVGNEYSWMSPAAFLRRPMRWPQILSSERITFTAGPDFSYALCARKADPEAVAGLDLSALLVAVNSAEPVRARSVEAFVRTFAPAGLRRDAMLPAYGLAEATLGATGFCTPADPRVLSLDPIALRHGEVRESSDDDGQRLVSCGRPPADSPLRLRIVEPAEHRPLPERGIGEIWLEGATITDGYWRQRSDARPLFGSLAGDEGQWLRTGDLGFLDRDELFVVGRLKDLIIIHGRNHHPHDIESTVADAHPRIRPGCVIASHLPRGDEEQLMVVAEVDLRGVEAGDRGALWSTITAAIRGAVAQQHGIAARCVVLVPARTIDKTSSGKLARSQCRARLMAGTLEVLHRWDRAESSNSPDDPSTSGTEVSASVSSPDELSAWVLECVAERSGVKASELPLDATFDRLGLSSVSLVSLAGELEQRLGRSFSPTVLYDHPTPRALLTALTGRLSKSVARSSDAPTTSTTLAWERVPIAIVGMACRAPGGADDPRALWRLLWDARDVVGPVPPSRRDGGLAPAQVGGFLGHVDRFDPSFFGIGSREADWIDPQQRLLLECSWEALEDAAIDPSALAGHAVGVYMGISSRDYEQRILSAPGQLEAWSALGASAAAAVGRISHGLGLCGPSLAIDTACSSGLVAIHQACQALRAEECAVALAGGVNLILSDAGTRAMRRLGALSPTGRCRVFGADADGYVRSEGCGVVVLKRLADAQRDGDPIIAVIEGSAVNQDGASNGLTAPRGSAQQAVISAAMADAGVTPEQVGYVEAHGTGTPLGDPIEAAALAEVFAARARPLLVGSIKSNVGHAEAAAGVLGLIKAALIVAHRAIPASLHASRLNPRVAELSDRLEICTDARSLDGDRVGLSSFGFGGTNAHAVIARAPDRPPRPEAPARPLVWPLSTRRADALVLHAERTAAFLERSEHEDRDLAWTLACGRPALPVRAAVVADNARQAATRLRMRGRRGPDVLGPASLALMLGDADEHRPAWFEIQRRAFPSLASRMDAALRCAAEALDQDLGAIRTALQSDEPRGRALGSLVMQYALSRWWIDDVGLPVSCFAGHGIGQRVAECLDGRKSLADACRQVAEPGERTETVVRPMAAIRTAIEAGANTWLGIGPCAALVEAIVAAAPDDRVLSPAVRRPRADSPRPTALLRAAAQLFERGFDPRWSVLMMQDSTSPRRVGGLPPRPFVRRRHWLPSVVSANSMNSLVEGQGSTPPTGSVAEYYDALDTAIGERSAVQLTFGPLSTKPAGFSWLRIFLEPERNPAHTQEARQAQQRLRNLLWSGLDDAPGAQAQRILDVGCGYGTDLIELVRQQPGRSGLGLTLSSAQARAAASAIGRAGLAPRLEVLTGDSTTATLDGMFDVVLAFEVIHHIRDKAALLANVGRHLAPGGHWRIADFVASGDGSIEHAATSSWFIDADTWSRLLARHGLALDEAIDLSGSIARFLDDDQFDAVLADHPQLEEHPSVLASLRSYRGLGQLLARGGARYVVLRAAHRPGASFDRLVDLNRRTLARPTACDSDELPPADELSRVAKGAVSADAGPQSDIESTLRIALAELLGRLPKEVTLSTTWGQLGLDSLMFIELQQRLSSSLGLTLQTSDLTEHGGPSPLVAELQRRVSIRPGLPMSPDTRPSAIRTASDSASTAWPESLGPVNTPTIDESALARPEHLMVTGGTGFVGAFLLGALLRRTPARISALVRAPDIAVAKERLLANLMRYRVLAPHDPNWARIDVVVGDLEQPRLGLPDARWDSLSGSLQGIVHAGARLNYVLGAAPLGPTNVEGTRALLRLAASARCSCPVHLVSTLAVFESWPGSGRVHEDDVPVADGRYILGYSQSKALAEVAVRQAQAAGLPVTIHRPGLVGGCLANGQWNPSDFTCRLLSSAVALGALPDLELSLDLVPVDVLADDLVALITSPAALGRAWHHRSTRPLPLNAVLRWLRSRGYRVESIPAEAWADRVEASAHDLASPLRGLSPFFVERDSVGETRFERYADAFIASSDRTRAQLLALDERLPPDVEAMLTGRCGDGLQWVLPPPAS